MTAKRGRVCYCRLGANPLEHKVVWMHGYHREIDGRMDRLAEFLSRTAHDQ